MKILRLFLMIGSVLAASAQSAGALGFAETSVLMSELNELARQRGEQELKLEDCGHIPHEVCTYRIGEISLSTLQLGSDIAALVIGCGSKAVSVFEQRWTWAEIALTAASRSSASVNVPITVARLRTVPECEQHEEQLGKLDLAVGRSCSGTAWDLSIELAGFREFLGWNRGSQPPESSPPRR